MAQATMVFSFELIDAFYHEDWEGVVFLYRVVVNNVPRCLGHMSVSCPEVDAGWVVEKVAGELRRAAPLAAGLN